MNTVRARANGRTSSATMNAPMPARIAALTSAPADIGPVGARWGDDEISAGLGGRAHAQGGQRRQPLLFRCRRHEPGERPADAVRPPVSGDDLGGVECGMAKGARISSMSFRWLAASFESLRGNPCGAVFRVSSGVGEDL
jgi:hypothetical protein